MLNMWNLNETPELAARLQEHVQKITDALNLHDGILSLWMEIIAAARGEA